MKRFLLFLAVCVTVIGLLAGCGSDKKNTQETITIQAAASLKEAMTDMVNTYAKEKGVKPEQIVVNYAGSGTLRQQIEQGAPANIFISANQKHMKTLEDKGLVTDVKPLVHNELVLVIQKGKTPVTLEQLNMVNRLILGNPETVPAGKYGKEVLEYMNLWNTMESRIVYAKDVKAVAATIGQGAGDAGFVYKTDALAAKDTVDISAVTPADSHKPIIYPIGLIKKYDSAMAKDFYNFMLSTKGQEILEKYGFTGASK